MGFNRFVLNIVIRSILIALNAITFPFFFKSEDWTFTFIFLCIFFVVQIFLLIRYLTTINRDLANFLIHIKEQDSTLAFSKQNMDKIFSGLTKEFDKINQEIKKVNYEKVKKQNLLNVVLNQIGTGILVLNSRNTIQISNTAIKSMFDLENINYEFIDQFKDIKTGEQSIKTIKVNNLTRKILITLSEIKENDDKLMIYSFHDIDREITDYELQSWNGLIKVLSHEIMNTVTPIITVTDTIKDCISFENELKKPAKINSKDISDTNKGLLLIENRIKNLSNIVTQLRKFSELNTPAIVQVNIKSFIKPIIDIYQIQFPIIKFNFEVAPDTSRLNFDETLIELCVNNILKNAIEAISDKNQGEISIKAYWLKKQAIIEFLDNGSGIDDSILKKVFLPFYTTKDEGSGIGLSIARQIMFAHNGNIEIESTEKGTCVKLIFKDNLNDFD